VLDRKPHLLRPLAAQLWPPRRAIIDPAARLGLDLPSLWKVEDLRELRSTLLAAVARSAVAPADGARIARALRARLRAVRRLARLQRRPAH
jgi:hypothetical protein